MKFRYLLIPVNSTVRFLLKQVGMYQFQLCVNHDVIKCVNDCVTDDVIEYVNVNEIDDVNVNVNSYVSDNVNRELVADREYEERKFLALDF